MMPDTTQPKRRSRLLSAEEVADILCLAPKTIRAWAARREIPFVRVNAHNVRFREADVEELIERGSVAPLKRRRANPRAVRAAG